MDHVERVVDDLIAEHCDITIGFTQNDENFAGWHCTVQRDGIVGTAIAQDDYEDAVLNAADDFYSKAAGLKAVDDFNSPSFS